MIDRSDKSLRLQGSIARDIGIAIVTGKYPAGHVLTSEVDFAERNHISRTAYREAIRILSAKGLVESRPKTGTRITDPSRWHILDPDVLAWTFEGEPSQAAIDDLFELRMIIEPAAAPGRNWHRWGTHWKKWPSTRSPRHWGSLPIRPSTPPCSRRAVTRR